MAARRGTTSASEKCNRSTASRWTRRIPISCFVASPGHLFGPNPERGLYKTDRRRQDLETGQIHGSRTRASTTSPSTRRIRRSFTLRRSSGSARGGAITAAARAARCGNRWTAATPGPSWTARAGPKPKDGIYGRIAISIFRAKPSTVYAQVEAGASAGTGGGTTAEGGPARGGRGPVKAARHPRGEAGGGGRGGAGGGRWRRRRGGSAQSQRQRRVPLRRWRQDLDSS